MSSRAFERMLDEMLARLATEGIRISREQLRAKMAAAMWGAVALDEDGRIVDYVSGEEVEWPPLAN